MNYFSVDSFHNQFILTLLNAHDDLTSLYSAIVHQLTSKCNL